MVEKLKIENILNQVILKNENIVGKCQPDYITSLPYDLRTNNIGNLKERLDAIDEMVTDLRKENKSLESSNNRYHNEIIRSIEKEEENINNLSELFNSEITLDDNDNESLLQVYNSQNGEWLKNRFAQSNSKYDKVVTEKNTLFDQIEAYLEDNNIKVDANLLESYVDSCTNLSYDVRLWGGIGHILNKDSSYIMNDKFKDDVLSLEEDSGFLRGYYLNHSSNVEKINSNEKIIDDLISDGFRTQDKINTVRGVYDRDEYGDGLM